MPVRVSIAPRREHVEREAERHELRGDPAEVRERDAQRERDLGGAVVALRGSSRRA